MTKHHTHPSGLRSRLNICALATGCLISSSVLSQQFPNLPITPEQRSTASKVADAGVPLSDLSPNAPDTYVIKVGDTLWGISTMYLKGPWRWPELWGMNMEEIRNPHLIYPGQVLYLLKSNGRARLSTTPGTETSGTPAASPVAAASEEQPESSRYVAPGTVRVSPRVRYQSLGQALFTLPPSALEPFIAEPLIVDDREFKMAPRIVASPESRFMISRGDRAYIRGPEDDPIYDDGKITRIFRIFRNAKPLRDPITEEILGYEAQFLGKASLARGESRQEVEAPGATTRIMNVPATIDIIETKEEMAIGDRLVPLPERDFPHYIPHAPSFEVDARVVSIYGSAVVYASQNQIVVLNRGQRDGIVPGHVLVLLKRGAVQNDKTLYGSPLIKLPDERNGLLIVFKTFDKLSYGLVLEISSGVRVGDRLVTPN